MKRPADLCAIALVATFLTAAAYGQAVIPESGRHFWAISVPDVEASVKWYQNIFGLNITQQLTTPDGAVKVVILESPNLIVEIVRMADAVPLSQCSPALKSKASLHGLFKVGLFVADLEKTRGALLLKKVKLLTEIHEEEASGLRSFLIEDNSGNTIQLLSTARKRKS
jgi:predicted enzyme related to lactoylglutathione lyase